MSELEKRKTQCKEQLESLFKDGHLRVWASEEKSYLESAIRNLDDTQSEMLSTRLSIVQALKEFETRTQEWEQ